MSYATVDAMLKKFGERQLIELTDNETPYTGQINMDKLDAANEEIRLHEKYNVCRNNEFYNMANHISNGFDVSGKVTVKDKDGITFQVDVNDPRYLSGELVGATKGYINVKDINGNILKVSINDPRFLSGELIGLGKGKIVINNGSINRMIEKDVEIPEGWTRGYVKRKKAS